MRLVPDVSRISFGIGTRRVDGLQLRHTKLKEITPTQIFGTWNILKIQHLQNLRVLLAINGINMKKISTLWLITPSRLIAYQLNGRALKLVKVNFLKKQLITIKKF